MRIVKVLLSGIFLLFIYLGPLLAQEHNGVSSDSALQKLIDGNKHFTTGEFIHPNQTPERRTKLTKAQHPFAIILGCSDSRVPPEIIFDQGLGDLFVVRDAGNIVNDEVLGSIEYAVEHLGVRLIVVLGHQRCGAVSAAVQGGEVPGHIQSLVEAIRPAVEKARGESGSLLENAINENIAMVVKKLKTSEPILEHFVQDGDLKIIGARYDLDDGNVVFSK
jgi:carbonic anhydrase